MKGCISKSIARHLSLGSFCKLLKLRVLNTYHREIKSAHSIETNGEPIKDGAGLDLI